MEKTLKILILVDSREDADLISRGLRRNGMAFTSLIVKKRKEFEVYLSQGDHFELKEILNLILISAHEMDGIIMKIVRKTEEIDENFLY